MSSHTQQRSLCALGAMTSGKVCAHWYIDYSQYVNLALQAMNAVEAWQRGSWLIGYLAAFSTTMLASFGKKSTVQVK